MDTKTRVMYRRNVSAQRASLMAAVIGVRRFRFPEVYWDADSGKGAERERC